MASIRINNISEGSLTYQGQTIASGAYYDTPADPTLFATDLTLLADLLYGNITITVGSTTLSGEDAVTLLHTCISVSIQSAPPFGAKSMIIAGANKKLFARNVGIQQALSQGSNTITYTVEFPWCKIMGIEAIGCEVLDTANMKVFDNAQGTYSGTPNLLLNQFAYSLNLPSGYYKRFSQFDADLYQGMVIEITYTSISAKTIGLNLLLNEVK